MPSPSKKPNISSAPVPVRALHSSRRHGCFNGPKNVVARAPDQQLPTRDQRSAPGRLNVGCCHLLLLGALHACTAACPAMYSVAAWLMRLVGSLNTGFEQTVITCVKVYK